MAVGSEAGRTSWRLGVRLGGNRAEGGRVVGPTTVRVPLGSWLLPTTPAYDVPNDEAPYIRLCGSEAAGGYVFTF